MLGKRSRFRKTTSMSQLNKPSFTLPENGARESSPESAQKGPLHQSDYSLGAPQFGFRREVFTDAPYKAGIFQNGPAMMAIEGASFAEQESWIQGAVCKTNHSLHCPSPLASPSNSSLLAPLAFGCARPQEALSEPSGTQMVAAGESQLTEWHRNTRSSVSLGVSFASVDGPHTLQTVSPASFLDACFLCKKRLGPRVDIFMYRGDTAFCSDECRDRQMDIDERRERASLASGKKATDVPNTVLHTNRNQAPSDTAAAVA